MTKLEELTRGAVVRGILLDGLVTIVDAKWYGSNVVELTYKDSAGRPTTDLTADALARKKVEQLAIEAVVAAENGLGRQPRVMPPNNPGYDLESKDPGTGGLMFVEVKGRVSGAKTVTLTKTEILTELNKRENYILALVTIDGEKASPPVHVRHPFQREPDFGVTSINYDLDELIQRGAAAC